MSHVWEDDSISGRAELLVLLALADHAKDDGVCWPSIDSIAKKTRLSQRGTQEVIQKLKNVGKLDVEIGAGPKGTNLYRVITGGCSGCTPQMPVGKNDGYLHPNHKEPSGSVKEDKNIPEFSPEEEVYRHYPKKAAKPAALSSIRKAIKKHGYEHILKRTKEYAALWLGKDMQFVPYPTTFYNQERYNDDWRVASSQPNRETKASMIITLRSIQQTLKTHPGNREWIQSSNATPEQKAEYDALRAKEKDLNKAIALS